MSASPLRDQVERALARHKAPGVSLALFDNGTITTIAAGSANLGTNAPMTEASLMNIGSIAKIFTTTLVLQLLDDGLVELHAPIVTHLPELAIADAQALSQITVQHLLNHTSGLDCAILRDHGHDKERIADAIDRFRDIGQLHPVGAEFSYCNAGMVIAGYLAQRLRNQSWHTLVRERIYDRLQMRTAAALPEEALLHNVAVGHFQSAASNELKCVSHAFLPLSFAPAGTTMMMTAEDLLQFGIAHLQGGLGLNGARILSETSMAAMQRETVSNRGKGYTYTDAVGLGWMLNDDGVLHHSGGSPGTAAFLYVYPASRAAFALLINAEASLAFPFAAEVLDPWLKAHGRTRPYGHAMTSVTGRSCDADSARYEGVYENNTHTLSVHAEGGALSLTSRVKFSIYDYTSTEASPPRPLLQIGDDQFILTTAEAKEELTTNEQLVCAFRDNDRVGRARYLGHGGRLHRRTS